MLFVMIHVGYKGSIHCKNKLEVHNPRRWVMYFLYNVVTTYPACLPKKAFCFLNDIFSIKT